MLNWIISNRTVFSTFKLYLHLTELLHITAWIVWNSKTPPYECPGYEIKQSDGEAPIMLKLSGMQSIPSLPSLPGPLWPRTVVHDRVVSMDRTELIQI